MSKRKTSNRGRDLRHTETQAQVDIKRYVSNERGRTDGRSAQSAVSGVSPSLKRKTPSTFRSPSLTRADLECVPTDAQAHVTRDGRVKLVTYVGTVSARPRGVAVGGYVPTGGHEKGTPTPKGIPATHEVRDTLKSHAEREKTALDALSPFGGTFARTERKSKYAAFRERADT